jgi:hypothetical protein
MTSPIDRRELLKRVAYLMGGALSTPAILGVLQGCSPKAPSAADWSPSFFTREQALLVTEVAEIMIPRTDTPGAKDVGVPAFIDTMLQATYKQQDQTRYLDGLAEFEAHARERHGKPFLQLLPDQQREWVREVHDAALHLARDNGMGDRREQRPFILMTKELTMLGFFTSEVGATQVLQYVAVPGVFRGCVPLKEVGNAKTWAT